MGIWDGPGLGHLGGSLPRTPRTSLLCTRVPRPLGWAAETARPRVCPGGVRVRPAPERLHRSARPAAGRGGSGSPTAPRFQLSRR